MYVSPVLLASRTLVPALACLLAVAAPAHGLVLEAGQQLVSARLGLGGDGGLTPSHVQLAVEGQYEYLLLRGLSAGAGLTYTLNIGSTDALLVPLGVTYRYQDLPWPVHARAAAAVVVGGLLNVRYVNLAYLGARLSAGGDYWLTKQLCAGLTVNWDLGGTLSSRNAYYWQLNVLLGVGYLLGA